jgi:8-oxo-dGTP pyrophosphatase MutT (NUDIX family)
MAYRNTKPSDNRQILKIGLAVKDGNKVLLLKKHGGSRYILPGGKPEKDEGDLETLNREIWEELGCALNAKSVEFLGSFTDVAADMTGVTVTVRLYKGELIGKPSPKSEIEVLRWLGDREEESSLAPSLRNQILPFLFSRACPL